jgi:Rad3-related DNA helicase
MASVPPSFISNVSSGTHQQEVQALRKHNQRLQSPVARIQEVIAARGSKANEDLSNVQGDAQGGNQADEDDDKEVPLLMKKGKKFDVPDGIIAHLTRTCRGTYTTAKLS